MLRVKRKKLHYLVLLFAAEYFSVYHIQLLTPLFAIFVIICSYYVLLKYNNCAPAIMMILSARIINGFIVPGVPWLYTLFMFITYYFPFCIFIVRNIIANNKKLSVRKENVRFYIMPILFTVIYIILFLVNIKTARSLFLRNIFPVFVLIICIVFVPKEAFKNSLEPVVLYLRMIFMMSLVLYILPHYEDITSELVQSGKTFGVYVEAGGTLQYLGIFRNNGIFFDCRILGIFAYLYIYVISFMKTKINAFDIILSGLTVATTLSRGGIVVYLLVLSTYFIMYNRSPSRFIFLGSVLIALFCMAALFFTPAAVEASNKFLSTFNVMNGGYNALSQRAIMSSYAINAFFQNPFFGGGVGSLTAVDDNRVIYRTPDVIYNAVTDAYLFSLLGEIGIFGTVFFLYKLYRLITAYSQKYLLSLSLFVGITLHLLGTDIPNMRLIYFCMLILICMANWNNSKNIQVTK